ncbi:MAG: hypothetical protein RLZZ127_2419 [Planctomycetota bacterium]|jgi:hypothetical protein
MDVLARITAAFLLAALLVAGDAPSPARQQWQAGDRIAALQAIAAGRLTQDRDLVEQALAASDGGEAAHGIRALRAVSRMLPEDLELVEPLLAHPDPVARLEAIQAMVAADHDEAVPLLIVQAQNPDAAWREPMIQGVRALVRSGLPAAPGEWDAWYRASQAKADQAMLAAEPALAGPDAAKAVQAMRDLVPFRLHRSMIIARLAVLVDSPDPVVAGSARMAIKDLGGPAARLLDARLAAKAATAAAGTAVAAPVAPAGNAGLPVWVVPVGIMLTLVIVVVLLGFTPAGKKVREGTARFVRESAEKPGVRGATARLVRRSASAVAKGTQSIRRVAGRKGPQGH